MACIQEGLLVFAPNRDVSGENPPTMHAYVVTVEEILRLRLVARLVVLSCGFGPHERDFVDDGHLLANSFLVAGAQCVVSMLWAVPNKALDKFYYNFYSCLQKGNYVTTAVTYATTCLRKDDRYVSCWVWLLLNWFRRTLQVSLMRFRFAATGYWTPVVVLGKDVFLSVKFIRHAQLHQLIDEAEEEVAEKMPEHPLDPRPLLPKGGRLSPALVLPLLLVIRGQRTVVGLWFSEADVGLHPRLLLPAAARSSRVQKP